MLWYKAWRESRLVFLLGALALAMFCTLYVLREKAEIDRAARAHHYWRYTHYIWRIIYAGLVRNIFVMLVLWLWARGSASRKGSRNRWFYACASSHPMADRWSKGSSWAPRDGGMGLIPSDACPEPIIVGQSIV